MNEVMEPTAAPTTPTGTPAVSAADLTSAIQRVMRESEDPLTASKVKAALPPSMRTANIEEELRRLVSEGKLIQFPKFRSPHDRFWDRPMLAHIATLLRQILADAPLALANLKRKLPEYAVEQFEAILQEQVAQNKLFKHPKLGGSRGGERFGVSKADPRDYLRPELVTVFAKLEQLGFTQAQLRAGALELLHEEEWASVPPPAVKPERKAKPAEATNATPSDPAANVKTEPAMIVPMTPAHTNHQA